MAADPKIAFDPKVNFELPGEIVPLLRQAAAVSVAEAEDACFELDLAAREAAGKFDKIFAVAQADAKEVTAAFTSAAARNIETALDYARRLSQARTFQDVAAIQLDYLRTQPLALIRQSEELGRALAKAAMH